MPLKLSLKPGEKFVLNGAVLTTGAGAGYGTSFKLDRNLTSKLLGFDGPTENAIRVEVYCFGLLIG